MEAPIIDSMAAHGSMRGSPSADWLEGFTFNGSQSSGGGFAAITTALRAAETGRQTGAAASPPLPAGRKMPPKPKGPRPSRADV